MKTDAQFPIDNGTTITVSCEEGYINSGSDEVTCNTYLYQDFKYGTKTLCSTVGKSLKLYNAQVKLDKNQGFHARRSRSLTEENKDCLHILITEITRLNSKEP